MNNLIPVTYVTPVLHELYQLGYKKKFIFNEINISESIKSTDSLPSPVFSRLYGHTVRLLESETSCRSERNVMDKEITDLLCRYVANSNNLAEVIERAGAFNRVIGAVGGVIELTIEADTCIITVDSRRCHREKSSFCIDLASMNFYRQLFSWLIGRPIQLQKATFAYPRPTQFVPGTDLLAAPIIYDSNTNSMVLPKVCLDCAIIRSEKELLRKLDLFPFPFELWKNETIKIDFSARVRDLLIKSLSKHGEILSAKKIANHFNISLATLNRKLQDSNTTYRQIRSECLFNIAKFFLKNTSMTVYEIAERLDYGDDRSFRRAFQLWSELSPSAYRKKFMDRL